MARFVDLLEQALAAQVPFALGIVARTSGSSPQKRGAKAIFFADGRILGTLGGGCLEAEVQDRARRALQTGQAALFDLVLDHDFGWDDGLICGGAVHGLILPRAADAKTVWDALASVQESITWGVNDAFEVALADSNDRAGWRYRETIAPPCALWIAGSGHVAQALAPLAVQLDFDVTVFDDRPALANHERFPRAVRLNVGSWDKIADAPLPRRTCFGAIMTRGHQHDALVLSRWIQKPFAFLAMIGSKRKRRIIAEQFVAEGLATEEQFARVACPAGVDIDAVSVTEIAVSIAGQLVQERARLSREVANANGGGSNAIITKATRVG